MTAERRSWWQRLKTPASLLLSVVIVGIAGWGLRAALRHVNFHSVLAALNDLSIEKIAWSALFTFGSFLAISGQEYFALKTAGRPLPYHRAAFGSFLAQSVSHSTGYSFAVGAGLRYRFYSLFGVTLGDVAREQASFTGTLALAITLQVAASLLLHPALADHVVRLPQDLIRGVGAFGLVVGLTLIALTLRRKIDVFGYHVEPPPFRYILPQVVCSVLDLCCLAAAAWTMLPAELHATYPSILAIGMVSFLLATASSVPGGLGVFESSILFLTAPGRDLAAPTIGALVAFRAIYYLVPLALGLLALAALELWRKRHHFT